VRDRVVEHGPIDDVRESSLQGAHRFHRGLPVGFATVVVGAAFGLAAELDGRHDVEDAVDLSVPGARQPVSDLVT